MNNSYSNYPRVLPTSGDFLNYNTNDLLYGAMYYFSTFDTGLKQLYLTKQSFQKHKDEICKMSCINNSKTLKRHLDKLIELNLIQLDDNKYFFMKPRENTYEIVGRDILKRVLELEESQSLRIYSILVSWYRWKNKEDDFYIFSNKELLEKLGYSSNNKKMSAKISEILEKMNKACIITYKTFYTTTVTPDGREVPVPRKKLYWVST